MKKRTANVRLWGPLEWSALTGVLAIAVGLGLLHVALPLLWLGAVLLAGVIIVLRGGQ